MCVVKVTNVICAMQSMSATLAAVYTKALMNTITRRRGSRIMTDRFPKRAPKARAFSEVRGLAPPRNYLDFYSLKSPFLGFRVIQMGYWPDFNLENVFIFKNIFNMKNVTDFCKTVETGVDPHLTRRAEITWRTTTT